MVALQEAVEFHQHEDITRQFHVAHFRGLATLFNKDTLEPDLQAESVHVLPDNAHCGEWAIEAVVSEARFGHIPRTGTSSITMMSLRWRNGTRNGPMYVVLSSLQIVMQNGSYVRTARLRVRALTKRPNMSLRNVGSLLPCENTAWSARTRACARSITKEMQILHPLRTLAHTEILLERVAQD